MAATPGPDYQNLNTKSVLPNFQYDNLNFHPFAQQIKDELENENRQYLSIKFNTLLRGFGYLDFDDSVIIKIQKQLQTCNLFVQIPLNKELKLEEYVNIVHLGNLAISDKRKENIEKSSSIQEAVNSVVQIITPTGTGTGFIIDSRGIVITARHVVNNPEGISEKSVLVRQHVQKTNQRDLEAVVFLSHRQLDFAFLWIIKDDYYPEIKIGNPKKLDYTQKIYSIGCPGGLPITVTDGIVGNPIIKYQRIECIQCNAAIDHGNSGGPLLNENGEVIGITVWGFGNFAAAKFSVPIDYLSEDIKKLHNYDKEKILNFQYCPSCGYLDYTKKGWYCNNCGYQFVSS